MVGLVLGLLGAIGLAVHVPEADPRLYVGLVLWYATLGAIVGVFGVWDRHPVLDFPMPWWVRSTFIGAWMNLVLVLMAYDTLASS